MPYVLIDNVYAVFFLAPAFSVNIYVLWFAASEVLPQGPVSSDSARGACNGAGEGERGQKLPMTLLLCAESSLPPGSCILSVGGNEFGERPSAPILGGGKKVCVYLGWDKNFPSLSNVLMT